VTVVVSFQRAINVGSGRSVPMADLRAVYESLGCTDVRTFLQSGNVVFSTTQDIAVLTPKLEAAIAARFGFAVPVINRSIAELRETMMRNPYPDQAKADPAHLLVMFLPAAPSKAEQEALARPINGPERMTLVGADLYIHYAEGIGRSKLKIPLKAPGTGRNWTTITKLLAMAEVENSQPAVTALQSRTLESAHTGESAMAKGQVKTNKEKRKPKADKNKPKTGNTPMAGSGAAAKKK
jgi:uncharacterized protein (DUF1697 family)